MQRMFFVFLVCVVLGLAFVIAAPPVWSSPSPGGRGEREKAREDTVAFSLRSSPQPERSRSPQRQGRRGEGHSSLSIPSSRRLARRRKRRIVPPRLAPLAPPPRLAPIAPPLPQTRKVQIKSLPRGLKITIRRGSKTISCQPANQTPCQVEIPRSQQVTLSLDIQTPTGHTLKRQRLFPAISGKAPPVLWQLTIAERYRFLTRTTPRLPPRGGLPPRRAAPPAAGPNPWIFVAVGLAAAAVAGTTIGLVLYNRNRIGFRCSGC